MGGSLDVTPYGILNSIKKYKLFHSICTYEVYCLYVFFHGFSPLQLNKTTLNNNCKRMVVHRCVFECVFSNTSCLKIFYHSRNKHNCVRFCVLSCGRKAHLKQKYILKLSHNKKLVKKFSTEIYVLKIRSKFFCCILSPERSEVECILFYLRPLYLLTMVQQLM